MNGRAHHCNKAPAGAANPASTRPDPRSFFPAGAARGNTSRPSSNRAHLYRRPAPGDSKPACPAGPPIARPSAPISPHPIGRRHPRAHAAKIGRNRYSRQLARQRVALTWRLSRSTDDVAIRCQKLLVPFVFVLIKLARWLAGPSHIAVAGRDSRNRGAADGVWISWTTLYHTPSHPTRCIS